MRKHYEGKVIQHSAARANAPKSKQTATPSKYPQGHFKDKKCRVCVKVFKPSAPSELTCSDYCRMYLTTEAYYKRTYGITVQEYLDIAESQNFKCKLCGNDNFKMAEYHSGVLVVDHCHKTGQVRGLLCHNCNRALGLFDDNADTLRNAISYLERATTIRKE